MSTIAVYQACEGRGGNCIILSSMELPHFKYHPNPTATGSIVPSAEVCPVCGQSRGFAYNGIPYGSNELEHICPWCIADGTAHEKFGVEFTDTKGVGGYGRWEKVPTKVIEEVGVQNSPNCVAKLRRDSLSVLADHVRVDRLRDWRAISVAESLLEQFLRFSETAHQSCVRMTERVEAIAAWHLDTKRPEQRSELSFEQQVLIPRRSVASGEEQPTLIRMPRLQECPQVPADLRGKLDNPN